MVVSSHKYDAAVVSSCYWCGDGVTLMIVRVTGAGMSDDIIVLMMEWG